ncbi:hypothetical protein ASF48_05025 [Rathayibacter sp. Leaf299]|uniref:hypothetical protein n=1 Tax=Rathayibacter sp. Leaf299 TaxID=1736328 RepID=UPI0006FD1CF3|nr:hypothetical protein [Rathayibacter sp. Leaf299]KQQ22549.1 hypothetical protein ASF48_05025 [Rathayibacter sp. Leaf299]
MDLTPIGYDAMGAPLYRHQLTDEPADNGHIDGRMVRSTDGRLWTRRGGYWASGREVLTWAQLTGAHGSIHDPEEDADGHDQA